MHDLVIRGGKLVDGTVESVVIPMEADAADVDTAVEAIGGADLVIVATAAAQLFEEQGNLLRRLHEAHDKVVVVAQRTPWDLLAFPNAHTYLCAWSVNPASMKAAANALVGAAPITGRLPVAVGGFDTGFGIDLD